MKPIFALKWLPDRYFNQACKSSPHLSSRLSKSTLRPLHNIINFSLFQNTVDAFKFIVPFLNFHKEGMLSSGEDDEDQVEFDKRKIEAVPFNQRRLLTLKFICKASKPLTGNIHQRQGIISAVFQAV